MKRRNRNALAALATALMLALPTVASAQNDGAQAAANLTYTYDIEQFGQTLGQTTMSVARSEVGYTANSSVAVAGIFQADNQLEAKPDGSALSYTIEGTAQGAAFRIDVEFTDAGADLTLTQGGATQSMSVPSEAPFYVFDNNFLEGYQLAADQVMATGEPQVFAALVPQTVSVATLGFAAPKAGTVEYLGATRAVTQIDVAFAVAGQALAINLYLDDAGHILVLEQQPGAVRFVRQPQADGAQDANSSGQRAQDGEADKQATQAAAAAERTVETVLQANAHCVMEQEVSVTSTGETLVGRLTLPVAATLEGGAPAPTLLLLPGSGAVDMDGNARPFIVNAVYKQLAFELACHGFGVLRVAKLGMAPSTGDGNAVTLGTYAQNTADWLAFLADQPGVDARRLGVIGHSEGGLVALYSVAQGQADPAALVLLSTPGRPMGALLREQLLASFQRSGISGQDFDQLVLQTDQALAAIAASEGYTLPLEGALAENQIAASFAHAAGLLRTEMEQDPALLAHSVQVPALVVQGLKDVQVLQVDGRNLAGALQRGTLLEFADMGHGLNRVTGDPESGMIPAADAAVSATLTRALVTWLNGHLRTAR